MTSTAADRATSARSTLARHPIAVEAARAAAAIGDCPADVTLFDEGRAFMVASSETAVLQPRHLLPAETTMLLEQRASVHAGGATAFAVRDVSGHVIGGLTLHRAEPLVEPSAVEALARMISTAARAATDVLANQAVERAVLDGLRDVVVVLDPNLVVTWVNRAVGSLFGRTAADVIGRHAVELLHPDDVDLALGAVTRLTEGLEIYRVFVRVERGDGGWERVEITGVDQTSHPALGGLVLSLRAALVEEELEAAVERTRRMSDAIVAGLSDGVVATDQFGAVTMVNNVARSLFGLDPQAAPTSLDLADFALLDGNGNPLPDHLNPLLAPEPTTEWPQPYGVTGPRDLRVIGVPGDLRYLTTERRPVHDGDGALLGFVITFQDVTDARKAAEELRSQARHDQLTGLANRRQLEERLAELATSRSSQLVAACFIDLDRFKSVNDTHGHRSGDELIRIAAKRLRSRLRTTDLLVRQGGDEFVALLVGVQSLDEAIEAAERFCVALGRPYTVGDERFDLSASIGLAIASTAELPADTLLRDADIALYAAKARGRNRVEVFNADLATAVEVEDRQRRVLRDALENDRVVMHFQPVVATATGRTVGYEALARCRTEAGQLIGPSQFMDAIANSGLMWDLDRTAFDLSMAAAAILQRVTVGAAPTMACNFSAISLLQPDLVGLITSTTARHGVDPTRICIEITESAAFDAGPNCLEALRSLHQQGFQLALDDFGTGYSSLAHLKDLPLTAVKVDRSFVSQLTDSGAERAIAEAIATLAGDLGLDVIAEVVESAEQLTLAASMGFTSVQGWHFSKALTLDCILRDWLGRPA